MAILNDTVLRTKVGGGAASTLVSGVDITNLNQQVRGCAVDLRIGEIYRPGTDEEKVGSASKPRESYSLSEGETAVIRTMETFNLDNEHTAFVFPASSVSIKGLLMTNPGHVDPGYIGNLHVTVINMAREPFFLKKGERFLRAILYKLDNGAVTPSTLNNPNPINAELLERLSPDFMSVNTRAQLAVKREIQKSEITARVLQVVIPALAAIVASYLTVQYSNESLSKEYSRRLDQVEQLKIESRLLTLENSVNVEKRFNEIEDKLKAIPYSKRPKH